MCTRSTLLLFFRSMTAPRLTLATEILALRQQLTVLNRSIKRPHLDRRDQFFRVMLSRLRKNWLEGLIIVKPETIVKWREEGSRLYHFNGAGRPAGEWTARQIIEAFSDNEAPRRLRAIATAFTARISEIEFKGWGSKRRQPRRDHLPKIHMRNG